MRTCFTVCCCGSIIVASGPTDAEKRPSAAPSPNPATPLSAALKAQLSMAFSIRTCSFVLIVCPASVTGMRTFPECHLLGPRRWLLRKEKDTSSDAISPCEEWGTFSMAQVTRAATGMRGKRRRSDEVESNGLRGCGVEGGREAMPVSADEDARCSANLGSAVVARGGRRGRQLETGPQARACSGSASLLRAVAPVVEIVIKSLQL